MKSIFKLLNLSQFKTFCVVTLILGGCLQALGQKVAASKNNSTEEYLESNKNLINSLERDSLSLLDVRIIDSLLNLYHLSETDSIKLFYVTDIIENIENRDVAMEYNTWLDRTVESKIQNSTDEQYKKMLFVKKAYVLMARAEYDASKFDPEAAVEFTKALELYKAYGTDYDVAKILYDISSYQSAHQKYEDALKYLKEGLVLAEKCENNKLISWILGSMGTMYDRLQKPDSSMQFYIRSLEVKKKLGDPLSLSISYMNIGATYLYSDRFKLADSCFILSLELIDTLPQLKKVKAHRAGIYLNWADLKNKTGKIYGENGAIAMGEKGLAIMQELKIERGVQYIASVLTHIYTSEKIWDKAYQMAEIRIEIQANLENVKLRDAIAEQRADYEYKKQKELDDALSLKKLAKEELKAQRQRMIIYLIGAGMVILILILVIIVRRLRQVGLKQEMAAKQRDVAEAMRKISDQKAKELSLKMEHEKLSSEMALLKSQISPHFLFNTLNNIYSLAFVKSDDAPTMIAVLADVLRYLIYESTVDRVLLSSEIEILEKYLKIQELRRIPGGANNTVTIVGDTENTKVPPLIMITLAENVFKHGSIISDEDGFVNIEVKVVNNHVSYYIENSYINNQKKPGIGLKNIQNQLDLLFGDDYTLEIKTDDQVFSVNLVFNTEEVSKLA